MYPFMYLLQTGEMLWDIKLIKASIQFQKLL